jgi:3',5'-cyclic AMP phosphodiesterase CpdA
MSDLHFGPKFNSTAFEQAVDEINSLDPDMIVITGDLSNEGLLPEFEMAKEKLSALECKNMIICSGNHDYRNTGYLLLNKFFPLRQTYEIGGVSIIVLKTARPDKDEGEVGFRQTQWMLKQIKKDKLTIIAMHHHLVPVPDTGLERHTVIDAGDVLKALRKAEISAVLCGHKHRPWKWDFENFSIIHAGSLSDFKLRGFFHNSYNIIEIQDNEIDAKVKIIGGKDLSFEELRN